MRVTQIHVRDSKSLREYAYHEDKNGSCRQDMEDNYIAEDEIVGGQTGLFSILDGHGGADISEYCAKNLPTIFKEQYQLQSQNIKQIFTKICQRVDTEIIGLNSSETGTTCCLIFVRKLGDKKTCYIANLGDTRAVICTDKNIAKRVTVDHKVSNPSEADRIKSEGGTILKGRVAGQLAITRALGDLQLKPYGVSNIPDYEQIEIDAKVQYMIVASDGLWDVCQDQQAIEVCKDCTSTREMAKALVTYALNNGTRDNTSVLVLRF